MTLRYAWLACFVFALAALPAHAQSTDWIELSTPRFTVISQASEQDAREWAAEYERFVDALHQVFPLDERWLPPLSVALFRRGSDFAPYRIQTESGVARRNTAVFANFSSWSVIGIPAGRGSVDDRRTTYHEAVHWFLSADSARYPLWFDEGIAEVFSTFEVSDATSRWGQIIPDHVGYLQQRGLQPMREFLRVSQDDALHRTGTYYPQAWLFVHYLMFGNGEAGAPQLSTFLGKLRETSVDRAFETAFGTDYGAFDRELRAYVRGGRYSLAEAPVRGRAKADDAVVRPASEELVELTLARLAAGAGNLDLALEHAQRVLALSPESPEAHDVLAIVLQLRGNHADFEAALDRAIELGTKDARTYLSKAALLYGRHRQETFLNEQLAPGPARQIADLALHSINFRAVDANPYHLLVEALLCVAEVRDDDVRALEIGRVLYPSDGMMLLGLAAVERIQGDGEDASRLIEEALQDAYDLPRGFSRPAQALADSWAIQDLTERIYQLTDQALFDQAVAEIDRVANDDAASNFRRRVAGDLRGLVQFRRVQSEYTDAMREGDHARAKAIVEAAIADPNADTSLRRMARDMLESLPE